MKTARLCLLALTLTTFLSACSSSSDDSLPADNSSTVRPPVTSPSPSPSPSPTDPTTPTPTPEEPTPTPQPEPSPTPSPAPAPEPEPNPAPNPSPSPAPTPEPNPAPSPEPSPAPVPTPQPSPGPSPQPTPEPSPAPLPTPVPEPSPAPQPEPTPAPPVGTTCPVNYEYVSANAIVGTSAFCLAKFEMKNVNSIAKTQAAGKPWLAGKATATAACAALGSQYRLPTNAEWNAAALEIYNNAANWSGNAHKTGRLYTGFYSGWTEPIEISDITNPYSGTGKNSGSERRTFVLASGSVIWDFAGNAWEWVSDTIYGNSYTPDLSSPYGRSYHNNNWDVKPGSKQLFDFTGMTSVPKQDVYLGNLFGGSNGKVIRGGAVCIHSPGATGIFTANIGDITADDLQAPASWNLRMNNVGFRCVTTPQ
ncbi:SUMF1/EgtB/PvdO family nonheme iron enzyme [Bdellovibrio bacteriovorus]|uniref:SUMF1/EgtB/PvdO family nonheme iron enzyme n=1 Tax=Bdellovibrio bacteriovorus TaxID=959 RepID=UPI0012DA9959|nr:SUMF1/EgtB/PvdO family nonheme iron enzyme [Bdellovibrio bacteriovorus]